MERGIISLDILFKIGPAFEKWDFLEKWKRAEKIVFISLSLFEELKNKTSDFWRSGAFYIQLQYSKFSLKWSILESHTNFHKTETTWFILELFIKDVFLIGVLMN